VLDVDVRPRGNGYHALRRLRQARLLDLPIAAVATPSGGMHLYYRGTSQASGRLPGQHLDFKAVGGYVLAPPSVVGGKRYRVIQLERTECPTGPRLGWAAVSGLLAPSQPYFRNATPPGHAEADRLAAWVARLPEGNRNAGLFWAACRVAETGYSNDLDILAEAAQAAGLPEWEIARTIASAHRSAGREQPGVSPRGRRAGPRSDHEPEAVT
jgi:hypothetical protein